MVLNRSKYETQFDCKLETQGDQVVVKKEKKMSEKKRRRLEKLKEKLKNKKESKRDEQEYRSKFKGLSLGKFYLFLNLIALLMMFNR